MRDDFELVARAAAGDHAAFDDLFARHRAFVYQQALAKLSRCQDAEEVTQRVFIKAYLGLKGLREPGEFRAWLRAITYREVLSWVRAERSEAAAAEPLVESARDPGLGPEEALLEHERRQAVRRALSSLPEHERRVARAFYLEGSSYQEIGHRYGLARASIAGYLYRARRKLADRLAGLLSGVAWLPGLESWAPGSANFANGGAAPMVVSKAAVATATVVTVAVVASMGPAPQRPAGKPATPAVQAVATGQSTPSRYGRDVVVRALAPVRALAKESVMLSAAEAAPTDESPEIPRRSEARIVRAEENEIVFEQEGRTRRFVMRDGRLVVEEDGRSRPATEAERRRFESIQDRMRAVKENARRLEERAQAIKPHEEEIRRNAERIRERAESAAREMERSAESLRREIESKVRLRNEDVRRLESRAREMARDMEKQADEWRRSHGSMEGFRPDLRGMQDHMKRVQEIQAEAQRMASRVTSELEPLLKRIGPLVEQATRMQREVVGPQEIQKMVDQVLREVQPLLKEVGPITEEAQRLQEEMLKLNEESRRSDRDSEPDEE